MNKSYRFKTKGKALFIFSGIFCSITLILLPFGIIFFYMAAKAHLTLHDDHIEYKMMREYNIPYNKITKLQLAKPVSSHYMIHAAGVPTFVNFATVVPLIIHYEDKKIRISSNFFENSQEIIETLVQKSGHQIEKA